MEKTPAGMKIRQGVQTLLTQARGHTSFNDELFDLVNVDVIIKELDPVYNNYKILNLTDIHVGQWISPEYLEGVVEYVNKLEPDLITLTALSIFSVKLSLAPCPATYFRNAFKSSSTSFKVPSVFKNIFVAPSLSFNVKSSSQRSRKV